MTNIRMPESMYTIPDQHGPSVVGQEDVQVNSSTISPPSSSGHSGSGPSLGLIIQEQRVSGLYGVALAYLCVTHLCDAPFPRSPAL